MTREDCRAAERALSEHLNHSARRLRQSETRTEWEAILADCVRPYAARTAVFSLRNSGFSQYPAFVTAMESRDTVVTLRDASQLGAALDTLGEPLSPRCYLIPVIDTESTCAVIYAEDPEQPDRNALELIAQLAGSSVPTMPPAPSAMPESELPPELVQIAGLSAPLKEQGIPGADRPLHLKAQRYARVHVAQMLIDQYDAVEHGRRNRALYVYLKDPIEQQRAEFRRLYLDTCASMNDYYHEELVRTLANNASELLGPKYPGAMR